MSLNIVTIADPLISFNPEAETTSFILHEAGARKHILWVTEPRELFMQNGSVYAYARRVDVKKKRREFSYVVREEKEIELVKHDVFLLRKDPPVDLHFINHLTLLELLEHQLKSLGRKYLFVNSPSGVKQANEKIFPHYFEKINPPSIVACSLRALKKFARAHKKVVLKPLNASGGKGVLLTNPRESGFSALLEMATSGFSEFIMMQAFVPEATKGDRRILLLDGNPLGSFLRVPAKNDFRGNMHRGARWVKSPLKKEETKLVESLKPLLIDLGLHFVGVDLIGTKVTEINTTSPMGIREINQIDNSQVEKSVVDWIESHF